MITLEHEMAVMEAAQSGKINFKAFKSLLAEIREHRRFMAALLLSSMPKKPISKESAGEYRAWCENVIAFMSLDYESEKEKNKTMAEAVSRYMKMLTDVAKPCRLEDGQQADSKTGTAKGDKKAPTKQPKQIGIRGIANE